MTIIYRIFEEKSTCLRLSIRCVKRKNISKQDEFRISKAEASNFETKTPSLRNYNSLDI